MASAILRSVPWKWDVGSSNWTIGSPNQISLNVLRFRGSRINTTRLLSTYNSISPATSIESVPSSNLSSSCSSIASPWLMLPPAADAYNFYSIAEDRVVTVKKKKGSPDDDAKVVGSSHGWLALFNDSTNGDLFLSNPLTGRHVKLPSVAPVLSSYKLDFPPNYYNSQWDDDAKVVGSSHGWLALFNHSTNGDFFPSNPLTVRHIKLPSVVPFKSSYKLDFPPNYYNSQWVTRVVISGDVDDDENCRAMMTYTPEGRLAFCCPGRSGFEWQPIGDLFLKFDEDITYAREYEDFVYSRKHKLFFCATTYGDFEAWDLRDPMSPAMTPMLLSADRNNYPWAGEEMNLKRSCESKKSLVVAEPSGELYHVRRFVKDNNVPFDFLYEYDSDRTEEYYDYYRRSVPYKTVGFDVHRIDRERGELRYMDGSLDGLAMFVGTNHSFALLASDYPGLKPDSIYFTDVSSPPYWDDGTYGGHDTGVFDYTNGTISPCYYPIDMESIKRIVPSPIWFTPTQQSTQL